MFYNTHVSPAEHLYPSFKQIYIHLHTKYALKNILTEGARRRSLHQRWRTPARSSHLRGRGGGDRHKRQPRFWYLNVITPSVTGSRAGPGLAFLVVGRALWDHIYHRRPRTQNKGPALSPRWLKWRGETMRSLLLSRCDGPGRKRWPQRVTGRTLTTR